MHLSTARYLDPAPAPVASLPAGADRMAWTEVMKGLLTVIAGYAMGFISSFAAVTVVWIATGAGRISLDQVSGHEYTWLLVGGSVCFFASLASTYLLFRGKWRCVMNAPEHRGAKWLVFASMVCVCAAPALHFASGFGYAQPRVKVRIDQPEFKPQVEKVMARYIERLRESDPSSYMRLAGSVLAPLGPIFFVLFLRAVHVCLGGFAGARFTELYLLFVTLLFVGSLALLLDPNVKIGMDLLVCLGAGWVLSFVSYFVLIVAAVLKISAYVNASQTTGY
jgi:hypothetical protein